jgi:hypothetical protein
VTKDYWVINEEEVDKKKIETSIRANWIHFIDASLVREILIELEEPIFTVHDCFLVDIANTSKLIEITNLKNSEKVFFELEWNKKPLLIYSIFILI